MNSISVGELADALRSLRHTPCTLLARGLEKAAKMWQPSRAVAADLHEVNSRGYTLQQSLQGAYTSGLLSNRKGLLRHWQEVAPYLARIGSSHEGLLMQTVLALKDAGLKSADVEKPVKAMVQRIQDEQMRKEEIQAEEEFLYRGYCRGGKRWLMKHTFAVEKDAA